MIPENLFFGLNESVNPKMWQGYSTTTMDCKKYFEEDYPWQAKRWRITTSTNNTALLILYHSK